MTTLIYDGSWAGLLSAVFEIYAYRLSDPVVLPAVRAAAGLFGETRSVLTDEQKAARVWKGLQQRVSAGAVKQVGHAYLSEQKDMEVFLVQYIRYAFDGRPGMEYNYAHPAVSWVVDTAKKVRREKHRMEAFVRFQQTKDNLYFALIAPDFNVLPLIRPHFETRYADQRWVIYDTHRKYGLFYDGHVTDTVEIAFAEETGGPQQLTGILDEREELYKQLWQLYFDSVNIKARRNMQLHLRHMPSRYWKFLPEKHGAQRG